MSELPYNWVKCRLPQILSSSGLISDGDWIESKDQDPEGEIRLIQLADIGDGIFKNKSNRYMNSEKAELLKCTFLEKGDLLIARMPEPLGRACIFPEIDTKSVTVVDVCLIRLDSRSAMLNKLLMFWINSPVIRNMIDMQASGTTRRRITRKKLAELELPLPPYNEQIRIANKLDSLLAKVDAAQTRLEKIPTLLKRFRQSVLAAATSGELTTEWRLSKNLNNWQTKKLEEVSEIIDPQPSHRTPKQVLGGVPYIGIGDLRKDGTIDFEKSRKVSRDVLEEHNKRYQIKEGDFIFGKIGTLGEATTLPTNVDFTLSANVILIQPDLSKVEPSFLRFFLSSPATLKEVANLSTSTSQAAFGIKKMRSFQAEIPSIEEQKEIVRRVESLFALADSVEKQFTEAKKCTNRLTQSLLAKAFRGELVPQDPNDEPASELLKRIQNEREAKKLVKEPSNKKIGRRGSSKQKVSQEGRNKKTTQTVSSKVSTSEKSAQVSLEGIILEKMDETHNGEEIQLDVLLESLNYPYEELKKAFFNLIKGDLNSVSKPEIELNWDGVYKIRLVK